ncbi:hypothetical protein OTK49_03455 [Vibrio coralliirubri]|uniref:hypothetical protein n=1 Tax=Vibrio coralliirubri TaxID=1516159 RepID=UPI0022840664|nr:hypothetical protein [Vibrio coralliirubri]MCY9861574.1 hypothetical protein [Vibrio coralliirubri]
MKAMDVMRYRYSFLNQDLTEVVHRLNETFKRKFELIPSTDKYSNDKLRLMFIGVKDAEHHRLWLELIEDFYNDDIDAKHLIEIVRHEAFDQYVELKMASVKRLEKKDIPKECSRCQTPAPDLKDMRGIHPSFNNKSQWFSSDSHKWTMATELRDRNLAGFDPLFDHPENAHFEQPYVAITELQCPTCREAHSKMINELLALD